jgi:hypothetical protein
MPNGAERLRTVGLLRFFRLFLARKAMSNTLGPQRAGISADIYSFLAHSFSVMIVLTRLHPLKSILFASLLLAAAAPLVSAQAPATVKTKAKAPGQASVKSKGPTTRSTPAPAEAPQTEFAPAAAIDAKANALTANMQQNLGLTPQQTEKVRVINRRGVEQVENGRLRHKADPRKLSVVIESAGRSRLEALKDVLNPAQFAKYQRKREEKMGVPNVQGVQGNAAPGLGGGGNGE